MRTPALLALFCSFLFLAACNPANKIAEDAIEKQMGGDADVDIGNNGAMRVTTDEGTMEIGGQEVPANWPSDAPVYPKAEVTYSAMNNAQEGEPEAALILATTDSVAEVKTFYMAQIAANGWTMENEVDAGGMSILAAKKGNRILSVSITGAEGQTAITVGLGED